MSTPISAISTSAARCLDTHQQVTLSRERGDLLLDLRGEPLDRLIEEVDVREDLADDQRVLVPEATDERLAQRRDLLAQLAVCQVREDLGIGGALAERVEHRPAGLAEDVARDAIELDAGVLQGLMQPVGLPLALLDLGLAIAGEVAQLSDRLGRHEARPQQPGFK
jgi:hypothetical protein